MMREKYRSSCYKPENVTGRYVGKYKEWTAKNGLYDDGYIVVETNDNKYSIREVITDGAEIPESIRRAADERATYFPPYVEWPL